MVLTDYQVLDHSEWTHGDLSTQAQLVYSYHKLQITSHDLVLFRSRVSHEQDTLACDTPTCESMYPGTHWRLSDESCNAASFVAGFTPSNINIMENPRIYSRPLPSKFVKVECHSCEGSSPRQKLNTEGRHSVAEQ